MGIGQNDGGNLDSAAEISAATLETVARLIEDLGRILQAKIKVLEERALEYEAQMDQKDALIEVLAMSLKRVVTRADVLDKMDARDDAIKLLSTEPVRAVLARVPR